MVHSIGCVIRHERRFWYEPGGTTWREVEITTSPERIRFPRAAIGSFFLPLARPRTMYGRILHSEIHVSDISSSVSNLESLVDFIHGRNDSRTTKGRRALGGHELRGRVAKGLASMLWDTCKTVVCLFWPSPPLTSFSNFLSMVFFSHGLGQLSHHFPLSPLKSSCKD